MKTVIEMAREAGVEFTYDPTETPPKTFVECWMEELECFAELVRADERNRLADKLTQDFKGAFGDDTCASWAVWIRGEKK